MDTSGNAFFGGKEAAPVYLRALARKMRQNPTPTEQRLWSRLRDRRLDGQRFRRQHILGRYIADFFAFTTGEPGLVIELDGKIHNGSAKYDEIRNVSMAAQGFVVLRFRNESIVYDVEPVLAEIRAAIHR